MATAHSREQGRKGFKRVMEQKLTPYERVKQYLMNKREPVITQTVWWGTNTTGKEVEDTLLQLEKEGVIERSGFMSDLYINKAYWQYVWRANR